MKPAQIVLAVVTASVLLLPTGKVVAQSKSELPNDFTLELLGRCILYSLSYQHTMGEVFGIEVGASLIGTSEESVAFLSLGGRAYVIRSNAAPCISGGLVYVTASTDSGPFDGDDSGVYFYVGPGFEYRSDGGFLFRGTVNFLVRDGFFVWPGVQVGIAF